MLKIKLIYNEPWIVPEGYHNSGETYGDNWSTVVYKNDKPVLCFLKKTKFKAIIVTLRYLLGDWIMGSNSNYKKK